MKNFRSWRGLQYRGSSGRFNLPNSGFTTSLIFVSCSLIVFIRYQDRCSDHVSSVPHPSAHGLTAHADNILDVPAWAQLPRGFCHESIYAEYSSALPAIFGDAVQEKVCFDSKVDLTDAPENFYTPVSANDDCRPFRRKADNVISWIEIKDTRNPPACVYN